jgi:hypothetical protein
LPAASDLIYVEVPVGQQTLRMLQSGKHQMRPAKDINLIRG